MEKREIERKLFQKVHSMARNSLLLLLLVFLFNLQPATINAQPVQGVDKQVEQAVLAEDWGKVTKLLDSVNPETPSPVLRMIKGHADLALNRNNESFRLIATATSADLAVWERWASDLAKVHPLNSNAHFYRADALARLEKHEDAIVAFTKAIELDANNAHAHHGRGVLYVQMGKYNEAGKDLALAQTIAPDVADFHNSRGMLRIAQRKGNLVRLEQQFKRATELSKDFALAQHALGCLELMRNPETDVDSSLLLRKAHNDLPEASLLFAANETDYELAVIEQFASSIASSVEDANAGMAIKREVTLGRLAESYNIKKGAIENLGGLPKAVAKLPSSLGGYGLKRIESQIVNEVKAMSPTEQIAFRDGNPGTTLTVIDAMINSQQNLRSKGRQATLQALPGVLKYIDTAKFKIGLNMNEVRSTINNLSRESSRSRLNLAVTVNRLRGADQYNSATYGRGITTPDNYKGTIQRFAPGPAINAQQGGATTDKREVVWGVTPWPFRPLFGLLYVPAANADLAATAHDGADKALEER